MNIDAANWKQIEMIETPKSFTRRKRYRPFNRCRLKWIPKKNHEMKWKNSPNVSIVIISRCWMSSVILDCDWRMSANDADDDCGDVLMHCTAAWWMLIERPGRFVWYAGNYRHRLAPGDCRFSFRAPMPFCRCDAFSADRERNSWWYRWFCAPAPDHLVRWALCCMHCHCWCRPIRPNHPCGW